MFSEELDKLRVSLHDAQQQAHHAEREQTRLASLVATERNRADVAEAKIAEQFEELARTQQRVRALAAETARISQLESDLSASRSEAKDFRDEVGRLDARHEKDKNVIADLRQDLSETRARMHDLEKELGPTRQILAAMKQRDEANRAITAGLGEL
jgi:chromosome segregation ATPase